MKTKRASDAFRVAHLLLSHSLAGSQEIALQIASGEAIWIAEANVSLTVTVMPTVAALPAASTAANRMGVVAGGNRKPGALIETGTDPLQLSRAWRGQRDQRAVH